MTREQTDWMTPAIRQAFRRLACELSPENLMCDGELSRSAVRTKYTRLKQEWRALEERVGRKVTEGEVWSWNHRLSLEEE